MTRRSLLVCKVTLPARLLVLFLSIPIISGVGPATEAWHRPASFEPAQNASITDADFARMVRDFSEDDGLFRSDNFVSNETSYLHIVDKLRTLGCTGGAYIGVGPEQNFTYIAKIRPRIAFIVDIRRQAVIQHLMFKAIFHLSRNRVEFLSKLFSKPVFGEESPRTDAPLQEMLGYFSRTPSDPKLFARNLAQISRTIEDDFRLPLNDHDRSSLQYIYTAFRDENLDIQYRSGGPNWPGNPWGNFPPLKEILLGEDLNGKLGNFLASSEDYGYVRHMEEHNRIIPIVGDFSGTKALAAISEYLKEKGYIVSAFYTSNVEQYLFANGVFKEFTENVRKLPINDASLFIRSFPNIGKPHPASVTGHRLTQLLEKIAVFERDCDEGLYSDYWELVTTHYIGPDMTVTTTSGQR
jgi:hypothetical protein